MCMYIWAVSRPTLVFVRNTARARTLSQTPLYGFSDYNNSTRRANIGRQSATSNRIPDSRKCNVTRNANSLPNLPAARATIRDRSVENQLRMEWKNLV